jgi:CRISPR-associated endonuclease Cas2
MHRPGWYLVAYDIRDPKRLRRVHRHLRRRGLAAQRSVFFVRRSERDLSRLLDELAELMHTRKDDLRAYPVRSPEHVWLQGGEPRALVLEAPRPQAPPPHERRPGLMARLLHRGRTR